MEVSTKGSLLIYPKVELKWDAAGNLVQDTFLTILNDHENDVFVHWYFVNGDGPLDAVLAGDPPTVIERDHPGWNWVDYHTLLTGNEPTYFSAMTGLPAGAQPFSTLDPGPPAGRPNLDGSPGSRVLRGFMVAFAVDELGHEITWNHLSGAATIVNYANKGAWEYNAYAYQTGCHNLGEEPLDCTSFDANGVCCTADVIPGQLNTDGFQYDFSFDRLLLDFYAVGSLGLSNGAASVILDTDLTLFPVIQDLRQDTTGPVLTKAQFTIWNENEDAFTGQSRCITCWDQALLSTYDSPNYFLLESIHTDKGKARIQGMQSTACGDVDIIGNRDLGFSVDAPLLGVIAKVLAFSGASAGTGYSGMTLIGSGEESGVIYGDPLDPSQELIDTWLPMRAAQSGDRAKEVPARLGE